MRCPKCGTETKPGAKFCGKCGQLLSGSDSGVGGSGSGGGGVGVIGGGGGVGGVVGRMPEGIALGCDEKVVKQYKIGEYTLRQGDINVIITNKRVIRYEESSLFGMKNNQIDEINIDAVHGVTTLMQRSISILGMVFALICVIFGIVAMVQASYYWDGAGWYFGGGAAFAVAALIILRSLRPTLVFSVLGSVGGPALATVVNARGRMFRNDGNSIIFQFKPTKETTVMLKEIGACIYDLKTLGDKAIPRWASRA